MRVSLNVVLSNVLSNNLVVVRAEGGRMLQVTTSEVVLCGVSTSHVLDLSVPHTGFLVVPTGFLVALTGFFVGLTGFFVARHLDDT